MRIDFIKCQGSGNDFALIDARGLAVPGAAWPGIARALADRGGPVGGDGILLLVEGGDGAAFGQVMFNPDGSESETCLNGLRCVARLGFERLGIDAATVALKVSDAAAERVAPLAAGVETIRTRVGPVSIATADVGLAIAAATLIDAVVPGLPSARAFTAVAMPNPHLVTFVDSIDEAELVALGDWCEAGPALIPARANVSFVMAASDMLYVRTYERGVGLTDSCGSAMGASVLAACLTGRIAFDAETIVRNRGGMVRASATRGAVVTIAGNASFEYDASAEIAEGRVTRLDIARTRDDEVAAWRAAIDAGSPAG